MKILIAYDGSDCAEAALDDPKCMSGTKLMESIMRNNVKDPEK